MFEWNSFAFISLICFLMSSASAVLTLFAKRQGEALLWGLICVLLACWTFGLFLCFSAESASNALLFARTLNYIVLFLPALLFHFSVTFVGKQDYYRRIVWLYYLISLGYFIVVFLLPEHFLHGASYRFEAFWFPYAGPLFYIFPVLYLLLVGHAIQILISSKKLQSRAQQRKVNYLLSTILIGLVGAGSSLTMEFGIDLPPYGIFSVAFVVLIATYAILRHDLLDLPQTISIVTARVLIYIIIFAVVVVVIKVGAFFDNLKLSGFQMAVISVLLVLICELYALMKSRVQYLSDTMLTRRKMTNERQFKRLIIELETAYDFEAMLPLLRNFLEKQPFIYHYAWYLDQALLGQSLKKATLKDYERNHNLNDSTFQRILFSARDGRRHDRLPSALKMTDNEVSKGVNVSSKLMELMNSEQLDLAYEWVEKVPRRELIALPLMANGSLRGLMMLVVSQNDLQYTDQNMMQTLSAKLALLIERFDSIREETRRQQAFLLEKMTSLKALAGDMAHELRLPLNQLDEFVTEVYALSRSVQEADARKSVDFAVAANKLRTDSSQARLAVDRSIQLIDILLKQVSRTKIDTMEFEVFSIQAVVSKALAEYVFFEGERAYFNLDLSQEFMLKGDEMLLVFVLFNLFKHALNQPEMPIDFDVQIVTKVSEEKNFLHFRYTHPSGSVVQKDLLREQADKGKSAESASQELNLSFLFCSRVMSSFQGDFKLVDINKTTSEIILIFPSTVNA